MRNPGCGPHSAFQINGVVRKLTVIAETDAVAIASRQPRFVT